ncbi:hypothetical protein [Enterovibrio norvegicus]|uniref:hypothetical protein n=1 Tax=Enterovibrio norvegicus TaxID=188144 RepID=UPI0035502895
MQLKEEIRRQASAVMAQLKLARERIAKHTAPDADLQALLHEAEDMIDILIQ